MKRYRVFVIVGNQVEFYVYANEDKGAMDEARCVAERFREAFHSDSVIATPRIELREPEEA